MYLQVLENDWADQLTAYDGIKVKYDSIGNMTKFGDKSYKWKQGNLLSSYSDDSNEIEYYYDENGDVKTSSNHNGGITGGITNGMPVSCTVTFKPTPSIGKKQKTINVETKENVELEIKGRHDPCIVQRAVVVVEAMMALGILDMMGE